MFQVQQKLGITVRHLREAKGWTQVELADKAQVSQGLVSQLEAGMKKNPGALHVLRLAKALGTTVEELLI